MKKIALFSIVRNEKEFLPIWYKYYLNHFEKNDIYIISNNTTDGCVDDLNCNVIKINSEYNYDTKWLNNTVYSQQCELLEKYNYTLYAEADEIMYHPAGLKNYCIEVMEMGEKCVRSTCWEIIHQLYELDIDWAKPLLNQRLKWYQRSNYYKPTISSVPQYYIRDYYRRDSKYLIDKNFINIHLHRIDYQTCKERNERSKKLNWNPNDLNRTSGWQHRLEPEKFDKYFFTLQQAETGLLNIPEDMKNAV